MAFGKNQGGWDNIYYFDMYTKKDEEPHFRVSTRNKTGSGYDKLPDATFVDGFIHSMYFKEELGFENRKEKNLYLKLYEGKDLYILRIKFFMIGRSIMNSLASLVDCTPLDLKLTIRVYRKKGADGEWWNRAYIGYGPENLPWTLSIEDMKGLTKKVTVNNKDITDTSRLDAKLTTLIEVAIKHLDQFAIRPENKVATVVEQENIYSDPAEMDESPGAEKSAAPVAAEDLGPESEILPEEAEDDLPF